MRLLNTSTLELTSFQRQPPEYAILSHTWGSDEAPFGAFTSKAKLLRPVVQARRRRYKKVAKACALAKSQGYQWIWIDTCCIDKTSSAELSEAINSMYLWYQRAAVCYAYLVDVPGRRRSREPPQKPGRIAGSRWFTRGWTLQELIAPASVEFYDASWQFIETKAALKTTLEKITAIPAGLFSGAWHNLCAGGMAQQSLHLLSAAQKLSWAAARQTTRPEDIAYCLMGLFGVHMPLLYGEGEEKAFARLQVEIARNTNDQSLFAWGAWLDHEPDSHYYSPEPTAATASPQHVGVQQQKQLSREGTTSTTDTLAVIDTNGPDSNTNTEAAAPTLDLPAPPLQQQQQPDGERRLLCYSLFAPHPSSFSGAGDIRAASRHSSALDWTPPFEQRNDGYLRIRLRVCRNADARAGGFADDDHIVFLDCEPRAGEVVVGLFVRQLESAEGIKRFVRVHELLGTFAKALAMRYESEEVLLGALPRHIPRFEFLGTRGR